MSLIRLLHTPGQRLWQLAPLASFTATGPSLCSYLADSADNGIMQPLVVGDKERLPPRATRTTKPLQQKFETNGGPRSFARRGSLSYSYLRLVTCAV